MNRDLPKQLRHPSYTVHAQAVQKDKLNTVNVLAVHGQALYSARLAVQEDKLTTVQAKFVKEEELTTVHAQAVQEDKAYCCACKS